MIDEKLKHLAIIMDGNGRWAQARGQKRSKGHEAGSDTLENLAIYSKKIGIKYLSVYAFSTDNFKRSKDEVDFLMNLFIRMFNKEYNRIVKEGIKVIFSGTKTGLRKDVALAMSNITKKSAKNTKMVLNICLNYGAQEEISRAALKIHKKLVNNEIKEKDVNKDTFYEYLDQNLPPIDLLIRTGGEKRLSNFMLYQLTYAEMYFVDTYFPDFNKEMLQDIIDDFYHRDRRFGGINEKKTNN